jgi:dihydroorotate dehydrogenase
MDLYQSSIRPILFSVLKADPEWLHQKTFQLLGWLDRNSDRPYSQWVQTQLQQAYCLNNSTLGAKRTAVSIEQHLWGLTFPNPLGLAAGFDKDGVAARVWGSFGFGFAELGTVTLHPQPGNPRPRLFRLLEDKAVLNRMGFNNQGAEALARRLEEGLQVSRLNVEGFPELNVKSSNLQPSTQLNLQPSNLQPSTQPNLQP